MYKVTLVLSVVVWAVVVTVIFSAPVNVRRTVQILRDTIGKTTLPVPSCPRFSISGVTRPRVQKARDVTDDEGLVFGGAASSMAWLRDATASVSRSRDLLVQRRVRVSNTGPFGAEAVDAKAVDLTAAREPSRAARAWHE